MGKQYGMQLGEMDAGDTDLAPNSEVRPVLSPLVDQALPVLIEMTRDDNLLVKDTVAWTLGRICDLLIVTIKPDVHLHPLVSALVHGLEDKPRIVANCCWALMNLSDQLGSYFDEENAPQPSTSPLQPYYEGVVQALLKVTDGFVIHFIYLTSLPLLIQISAPVMNPTSERLPTKPLRLTLRTRHPNQYQSFRIQQSLYSHVCSNCSACRSVINVVINGVVTYITAESITWCGRPKQLE